MPDSYASVFAAYALPVDLLSDVIAVLRAGRPRSSRVLLYAPWGQRFECPPDSAAFLIMLRGSCWLLHSDSQPLELSVGDVVFLPRGCGHALADHPSTQLEEPVPKDPLSGPHLPSVSFGQPGPNDVQAGTVALCGTYELDRGRSHPLLSTLPDVVHLPADPGHLREMCAAIDLLASELGQLRPGSAATLPALLDMLLVYILRSWVEEGSDHGWAAALRDPAISSALEGIHRDPARRWTVEELGEQAGLSRAAFSRRFAALVGRPPLAYLTWWRLTTAARLLRESDTPLSAVAAQVGYGSEFAFANAFKREYGTAPGRYRRHQWAELTA